MSFIQGTPRCDVLLFPEAIDDYVTDDNPVRFIEAFVDNLDLDQLDTGTDERESKSKSRKDEEEEGTGRASLRDNEACNDERVFSDEGDKESSSGDELDGVGLQHQESDKYLGSEGNDRGSSISCLYCFHCVNWT